MISDEAVIRIYLTGKFEPLLALERLVARAEQAEKERDAIRLRYDDSQNALVEAQELLTEASHYTPENYARAYDWHNRRRAWLDRTLEP